MSPARPPANRGRPLFVVLRLTLVGVVTAVVTLAAYIKVAGIPIGNAAQPSQFRGDLEKVIRGPTGIPVLFIGDSLTSSNSMPHMLEEIAAHAPDRLPILTYTYAPPTGWLGQALSDSDLQRLVHQVPWWSYVVLQENSHVSDLKDWAVYSEIDAANITSDQFLPTARPVVFETWAYRKGYPYAYPSDTSLACRSACSTRRRSCETGPWGNSLPWVTPFPGRSSRCQGSVCGELTGCTRPEPAPTCGARALPID